jgi:hypothetical protein
MTVEKQITAETRSDRSTPSRAGFQYKYKRSKKMYEKKDKQTKEIRKIERFSRGNQGLCNEM